MVYDASKSYGTMHEMRHVKNIMAKTEMPHKNSGKTTMPHLTVKMWDNSSIKTSQPEFKVFMLSYRLGAFLTLSICLWDCWQPFPCEC